MGDNNDEEADLGKINKTKCNKNKRLIDEVYDDEFNDDEFNDDKFMGNDKLYVSPPDKKDDADDDLTYSESPPLKLRRSHQTENNNDTTNELKIVKKSELN